MRRRDRMRAGLTDALDLTVICLEAGLSLEQAMWRVSNDLRRAHPDLAHEFYLVSREMHRGMPWDEAFCDLSERTGAHDLKIVAQSSLLSLAQSLRSYSESLRLERRRRAKGALKWASALVVFVLPSIVFVVWGPGLIQSLRALMATR
jgi:tight adherence protein C